METFFPSNCKECQKGTCNCADICVYKACANLLGWTEETTYKQLLVMKRCADRQQQKCINRLTKEALGECPTFLITFHFDQKLEKEKVLSSMKNLREALGKSNFKWFSEACLCEEFFSGDLKWNPHIHLATIKTGPKSNVVQALNRHKEVKELRKLGIIYKPFDIQIGKDTQHIKYVHGEKKEEKDENCAADTQFRIDNKLDSYYLLS